MGNSVPDFIVTDKMITELKTNDWFGVYYRNVTTDVTCKQNFSSNIVLCFKRVAINEAENGSEPVIQAEELK